MRENGTAAVVRTVSSLPCVGVALNPVKRLSLWLVLILALAGCASGVVTAGAGPTPGSSTSPNVSLPTPSYLGAATTPSVDSAGIHRDPPGVGQKPKVTWQYASRACQRDGGGCWSRATTATVMLAVVTDPYSGTARPDGTIKPLMDHALTYVVTLSGFECSPHGGAPRAPGAPGATPAPIPIYKNCSDVTFVSAATGKVMYEISGTSV